MLQNFGLPLSAWKVVRVHCKTGSQLH